MLIKYNRNNVHALGSFDGKTINSLKPGWNEFPSHIFKLYEKDAEIKRLMKEGATDEKGKPIKGPAIEVMSEKIKVGKKTVVIGQDDKELDVRVLPEARAIEIVKGTYDRKMLQRWIDEETRHKVKRAIDEQLKPLLPEKAAG